MSAIVGRSPEKNNYSFSKVQLNEGITHISFSKGQETLLLSRLDGRDIDDQPSSNLLIMYRPCLMRLCVDHEAFGK